MKSSPRPKPALSAGIFALGLAAFLTAGLAHAGTPLGDSDDLSPRQGPHAGERGDDSHLPAQSLNPRTQGLARYSSACKIAVLKKLGWNVRVDTGAGAPTASVSSGAVCEARSTQQIRTQNLLSLSLPWAANDAAHQTKLNTLLDASLNGAASTCAYKQFYGPALQRATTALYENHLYGFNSFIGSGIVRLEGADGWQRTDCPDKEKCFIPASGQIASSLKSLYSAPLASECGTGLQLAEYSAIRELMGDDDANKRFSPANFLVGDWADVNQSDSVIHGKVGRRVSAEDGLAYAQLGSKMLIGVPGYVGSLFDEAHLDDLTNRNENFIVVSATPAAARALVQRGGLSGYLSYLKDTWKLTRTMSQEELQALQWTAAHGELANATPDSLSSVTPLSPMERQGAPDGYRHETSDTALEVAKRLSDPFLDQTKIYVHPVGPMPISWHILRLARINPRTPYSLAFYAEATHGEIYDRWLDQQLDACGR